MNDELQVIYNNLTFDDVCSIIHEKQKNMAMNYIAIGYFLRKAKEMELYKDGGYESIHDMAQDQFLMARQTTDHCMRINKKFSQDGNSPMLAGRFEDFSKSQLQEMLYLTDEQIDEVTPDMTVKDIRNIRKPAGEKEIASELNPDTEKGRKPTEEEKEILKELARKRVLLIDDILDTGRTLKCLSEKIRAAGAASVKTCALLDKPSRREVEFQADFTGFKIEDKFVVGYGLDYAGEYRTFPDIWSLEEE